MTGTRPVVVAAGTVLAMSLAACGGSTGGGDEAAALVEGGTYTTSVATDPGNLDPAHVATMAGELVTSFAYDTLIHLDQAGNPVPRLASSWEVTPTDVTFTLREGVTCDDGSALTASQVAANFEYARDPDNQALVIGSDLPDTEFTVSADEAARTVTISREAPFSFLLEGAGRVPIVCAKGMADRSVLATGTSGTGPFRLVEAVAGDHYTFEARDGYRWGPNGASTDVPGFPGRVVVKVVQDSSTGVNMLLSGQLNDFGVVGTERQRLDGQGYEGIQEPGSLSELFFNQAAGHPGADPAVREALTTALNLDELRAVLTEGDGMAPTGLASNEPRACRNDSVTGNLPAHDVGAARATLDGAGWLPAADGIRAKGGERLRMGVIYPAGVPSTDAGMELLARWWTELGVEVEVKPTDANALSEELLTNPGGWDAAVLGIGADYPSQLVGFLTGSAPPDGQNFAAIANPDYDRLIEQAAQATGPAGCELWAQAETELFRRFDVVPVSISVAHTFLNKVRYEPGVSGPEPTSIRLLG